MKQLTKQFILFALVGLVATITQYFTLMILVECFNITPVVASSCGYLIGGLVSYYLNHRITFQSDKQHHIAAVQFFCVATVGFSINFFLMSIGTHLYHIPYLIMQIISTSTILFWHFLANRFWTFKITKPQN
jgi:putative flippase GtrA